MDVSSGRAIIARESSRGHRGEESEVESNSVEDWGKVLYDSRLGVNNGNGSAWLYFNGRKRVILTQVNSLSV